MQITPSTGNPNSDVFQDSVTHLARTAQKQKRVVLILGVILLLVLTAVSLYLGRRSEHAKEGREAFFRARTTLENELQAVQTSLTPPAPKADPKAKTPPSTPSMQFTRFPVSERLGKSVAELEKVGQEYKGVLPGFEAYMLLGQLHLEHGATPEERAKAGSYFERAAQSAPSTEHAVAAYQGMGFAQETQGDHAAAAKTFERVVNYGNTPFQADALKGVARNYELQKDFGNARIAYERIASTFPSTDEARFAQMKLSELPGGNTGAAPSADPKKDEKK